MVKQKDTVSKQELKRREVKILLKVQQTANQISKTVGITHQSVSNVRRRKRVQRKKGSGRKNILDKSNKLRIIHLFKSNPFFSTANIQQKLNLPCASKTIANYLKKSGFSWCKPECKPPLSEKVKSERVEWCKLYQSFKCWDNVVFTDEAGFWIFDNNKFGWFKGGLSKPIINRRYPGKLNVWCGISARGKVGINIFKQNLKSDKYIDILSNNLLPHIAELYPNGWYFQQDNHPVHTSRAVKIFIEKNMKYINWPRYSSDLSPIENLWPILKKNIRKKQPQTVTELENFIYEEWNKLKDDYISSLCKSIQSRITQCIENCGDKINY